jgi:hypothetical protein
MDTGYHTASNRHYRAPCDAIFIFMFRAKSLLASLAALAPLILPAFALGAHSEAGNAHAAGSVLHSRDLWATINVCNPKDQPNYVGIRGQMPGDGHPHDTLYMSFRVQFLTSTTRHWADDARAPAPRFLAVGGGGGGRQGGQSFLVEPEPRKPPIVLRGIVEFQWRRGKKVLQSATRVTTAGRSTPAHADPPGFSAATCQIG